MHFLERNSALVFLYLHFLFVDGIFDGGPRSKEFIYIWVMVVDFFALSIYVRSLKDIRCDLYQIKP